jgi:hypothetical protein
VQLLDLEGPEVAVLRGQLRNPAAQGQVGKVTPVDTAVLSLGINLIHAVAVAVVPVVLVLAIVAALFALMVVPVFHLQSREVP